MGIEIFIQDFRRLLVEIPSLPPRVQKPGAQDHDGLARALFELHLDGAELAVNDADHPLDLLRGDGPGPALLPQEVHHVGGKLVARLLVLLQLRVVDLSDLGQLGSVVGVLH